MGIVFYGFEKAEMAYSKDVIQPWNAIGKLSKTGEGEKISDSTYGV